MKSKILLFLFAVLFLTNIAYAESDCIRANPTVRMSPDIHTIVAGGSMDYVVEIINNDNVACGPSVLYDGRGAYNISKGYTLYIWDEFSGKPKPSVTPGGLLKFSMHVEVPAGTPKGTSYIEVLAINVNNSIYNSTARSFLNIEDVSAPECIRKNPTIKTMPENQIQTGFAGETSKYLLEIVNNDNAECGPSNMTLIFNNYEENTDKYTIRTYNEFPGGLIPLTNPGASLRLTMLVDVLPTTLKGTYYIGLTAENADAPKYFSTANLTLVVGDKIVDQNCVRAKPTVKVTPESQTGFAGETSKYIVEVLNNDNEFCAPSDISLTFPNYRDESKNAYSIRAFLDLPGGIAQPIKPGASYKSTMLVDVFPNTPTGTYYVTLVAQNQNTPIQSDAAYSVAVRPFLVISEKKDNEGRKCTDSDGGKNYYVKGITQDYFVGDPDYVGGKYTDYCYEYPEKTNEEHRFSVVEYWCEDTGDGRGPSVYVGGYYCPNGCKDGACIGEKETTPDSTKIIQPTKIEQNIPENNEKSINRRVLCDGCLLEGNCLPYGTRMQKESAEYCELNRAFNEQKPEGSICQNNYECTSNFCSDGQCVNIQKELKETRGLLQTILDFLKKLFNFG